MTSGFLEGANAFCRCSGVMVCTGISGKKCKCRNAYKTGFWAALFFISRNVLRSRDTAPMILRQSQIAHPSDAVMAVTRKRDCVTQAKLLALNRMQLGVFAPVSMEDVTWI